LIPKQGRWHGFFKPQDSQSAMQQYAWQGAYLSAHQPYQEVSKSNQT